MTTSNLKGPGMGEPVGQRARSRAPQSLDLARPHSPSEFISGSLGGTTACRSIAINHCVAPLRQVFTFFHPPLDRAMPVRSSPLSFLVVLLAALAGCGKSGPQIAPVHGHVTLDGQPLMNADVMFQPD